MEKQQIYNIIKLVAQLRIYQQDKKRYTLSEISIGEKLQVLDIIDSTPLIQHIPTLNEYFPYQNNLLALIRTYAHRRLMLAKDFGHYKQILTEENRIDAALHYITSSFPSMLHSTRSLQKHIAA